MPNVNELQQRLIAALKEQQEADQEREEIQQSYDEAFQKWEEEHGDLVMARRAATNRCQEAKAIVADLRDQIKTQLSGQFIDELPDGISQKRKKVVKYDPQGFLRVAVQHFPFLVKLNEKAVEKFFTAMAEEDADGALILPENIRCWASVEVVYEPSPQISEATLKKLEIDPDSDKTLPIVIEGDLIESPADDSDELAVDQVAAAADANPEETVPF